MFTVCAYPFRNIDKAQKMWKTIFMLICFVNGIIGYKIIEISTPKLRFAANPIWDPFTHSIIFFEFLSGGEKKIIHRYSYQDNAVYSASISSAVKSCTFVYPTNRRGLYAISNLHDADLMRWDGYSQRAELVRKIVTVDPNDSENGIVGGAADPLGRFYVGKYSSKFCSTTPTKSIYRYTVDSGLKRLAGGFYSTISLIFSADGCKAYLLDYCSLKITGFDVDLRTGEFYNRSVVFDFHSIGKTTSTCTPFGLALDTNGHIYTTDYRRSIYRINPQTKCVVQTIDVGISGISGITFGGPERNVLFVTASSLIVNTLTGQPIQNITRGSSLYAITGLCKTGVRVPNLNISTLVPHNNNC